MSFVVSSIVEVYTNKIALRIVSVQMIGQLNERKLPVIPFSTTFMSLKRKKAGSVIPAMGADILLQTKVKCSL